MSDFFRTSTPVRTSLGSPTKARVDHLLDVAVGIDHGAPSAASMQTMLPSCRSGRWRAAGLLDGLTISLLIELARTISTMSTVARVGDAKPPANSDLMLSLQHRVDLRAAAVDDHRVEAGELEQRDVRRRPAELLVAHGGPPNFTTTVLSS